MNATSILYLDRDADQYFPELNARSATIDIQTLAATEFWRFSPLARTLAVRATPDEYDLVVIGHNQGFGREYAKLLAMEMRRQTLITWRGYLPPELEATYRELGFEHFCVQGEQVEHILRLLGLPTQTGEELFEQIMNKLLAPKALNVGRETSALKIAERIATTEAEALSVLQYLSASRNRFIMSDGSYVEIDTTSALSIMQGLIANEAVVESSDRLRRHDVGVRKRASR